MTHEHLDHTQGLPWAAWKTHPNGELKKKLPIDYAWLTGSAKPDYYKKHKKAEKLKKTTLEMYHRIERHLRLAGQEKFQPFARFLANNNPSFTTHCVTFLQKVARKKTSYVHRSVGKPADGTPLFKVKGTHPFKEANFEIWAPEEDTSDYYGRFQPLSIAAAGAGAAKAAPELPIPPAGVDAGDFYNLVNTRLSGVGDNMLAIDKAKNNTSVVFLLEWRGWRLLFAGDAEVRSWKTMHREGVLKPVHFLKVSHHGSHNGTPEDDIFEAILPKPAADKRKRSACISTWTDTYPRIPHGATNARLKSRCELSTTLDDKEKPFYDVKFTG